MKNLKNLALFIIIAVIAGGCQEKITETYTMNVPVYMSKSEFKKSVKVTESEDIIVPGKIYFKDNYIFINEALKGIHVIDNTNPSDPVFVSFIEIPGNVDMAIKDSILFADSYVDLVAIDISDIHNIHEVGRIDSIFPYALPPFEEGNKFPMGEIDESKGIVVGWETKKVEIETTANTNNWNWLRRWTFDKGEVMYTNGPTGSDGGTSVGVAGSMARFTISGKYLYTVDQYTLKGFDIENLTQPLMVTNQNIGWGVETVFQYNQKLFFGTTTGMIIYDISNAASPSYITSYSHMRSCDPVVVEGNYAYITLRAGNLCGEATSQLDILNISDITKPVHERSYPMQEPYGLGIDNKTLFICDGEAGLKVYNASDPQNIISIANFPDVNAFDVIPLNGLLMMIGKDGLYQYDYSGPANMNLLSYIPILKRVQ